VPQLKGTQDQGPCFCWQVIGTTRSVVPLLVLAAYSRRPMITSDTVTPQASAPIVQFVTALGHAMLKSKVPDWLDMDAAATFCRQQDLQLYGHPITSPELEKALREAFHPTGEFYALGLCLDGYERPRLWERPFMIRAYPHWTATQTPAVKVAGTQNQVLDLPEPEVANIGNNVFILPCSHSHLP